MSERKLSNRGKWWLLAIIIGSILLFVIAVYIFVYLFAPFPKHQIILLNRCSRDLNVIVSNGVDNLPLISLAPLEQVDIYATPGVNLFVRGYYPDDDATTALTEAQLMLARSDYTGRLRTSFGNTILTTSEGNFLFTDRYGVSLQKGYNINIGIEPIANFRNTDPTNRFVCTGPQWFSKINGNDLYPCPEELQQPGVCNSPCTAFEDQVYCCDFEDACELDGGCENAWPNLDYYFVFASACPNCMITNCDEPNYSCQSAPDSYTTYRITFCETLTGVSN